MEIYNEKVCDTVLLLHKQLTAAKVRDLLGDVRNKTPLRVREHTVLGPYVEVGSFIAPFLETCLWNVVRVGTV